MYYHSHMADLTSIHVNRTDHPAYANKQTLSPVVARALDLWMTGVAKTKKEAAEAMGIHPLTLQLNSRSPAGIRYMESAHQILQDKTIDTSALIQKLARRGIEVMAGLMEDSQKDEVRFRAAQDLADRGKETGKVHKVQAEVFTVTGRDVNALAEAMVKAADLRSMFPEAAEGNFLRAGGDDESAG